jgi:hypothetical protein
MYIAKDDLVVCLYYCPTATSSELHRTVLASSLSSNFPTASQAISKKSLAALLGNMKYVSSERSSHSPS